jgi:hypothetical protein
MPPRKPPSWLGFLFSSPQPGPSGPAPSRTSPATARSAWPRRAARRAARGLARGLFVVDLGDSSTVYPGQRPSAAARMIRASTARWQTVSSAQ